MFGSSSVSVVCGLSLVHIFLLAHLGARYRIGGVLSGAVTFAICRANKTILPGALILFEWVFLVQNILYLGSGLFDNFDFEFRFPYLVFICFLQLLTRCVRYEHHALGPVVFVPCFTFIDLLFLPSGSFPLFWSVQRFLS